MGKIATTLRMQEPTTRKRGHDWNPERDKVKSPESSWKFFLVKKTTVWNQCRKKQSSVLAPALNNNRALLQSFANLWNLRSKRRPQSTAKAAESEMGNYPTGLFPIAFYRCKQDIMTKERIDW